MPKSTPRFMEHGVDTCRLINFPVVAMGQLPQPFQEWLGRLTIRCFSKSKKSITSKVYGMFWTRTTPFWGFHGSSDILQTLLVAPPSWFQDGCTGNDVKQDMGRTFRTILWWWWKMAALPLPAAILDDRIPGWREIRSSEKAAGSGRAAIFYHNQKGVEKFSLYYWFLIETWQRSFQEYFKSYKIF